MYTALYDGFDGTTLNRNIWDVEEDWKRDNTQNIWVDSPNTVSQNYGKLNLTMLYSPGYTTTMWNDSIITADYISGEVTSYSTFFYGSFECSAKYANQRGSWPAFWAIGGWYSL
jgi:beta-glucanase (GH16 family)